MQQGSEREQQGKRCEGQVGERIKGKRKRRRTKDNTNFKGLLSQRTQRLKQGYPEYTMLRVAPPDEKRLGWFASAYQCRVTLHESHREGMNRSKQRRDDDETLPRGIHFDSDGYYRTKKKAEQSAAEQAIQTLRARENMTEATVDIGRV
jgi:dsRNA-specific ribonuclease